MRLAAAALLVPSPGMNLTRYHGAFAPHHGLRARVVAIDIEKCERCGGPVKIIAGIEDSEVIEKILQHLGLGPAAHAEHLARAGPEAQQLFD